MPERFVPVVMDVLLEEGCGVRAVRAEHVEIAIALPENGRRVPGNGRVFRGWLRSEKFPLESQNAVPSRTITFVWNAL